MSSIHIGYLRSGLQLTLGKVYYTQLTRAVHVDWGAPVTYFDTLGYVVNEASAKQLLGVCKRKEQQVFAKWASDKNRLLNHAEGQIFKERKCKKKQETSVVKK